MKSWLEEIDRATTEAEVLATARDYCSLFSPRELESFPEDCRVIRIESRDDIPRWRKKLESHIGNVRDRLEDPEKVNDLVRCLERAHERLGSLGHVQ